MILNAVKQDEYIYVMNVVKIKKYSTYKVLYFYKIAIVMNI